MEKVTKPYFCPYCGGTRLLEDEPTEIQLDEEVWIVYHWVCEECGEYFDKVIVSHEEGLDSERYWE